MTVVGLVLVGVFGGVLLLVGLMMIFFRRRMAYGFTGVYGKSVDSKMGRVTVAIIGGVCALFGLLILAGDAFAALV
jgi:hypothetical protein